MATIDQTHTGALASETANIGANQNSNSLQRQQRLWGWIFLSPWLIGFVIFTAAPIIASFIFTFTQFNLSDGSITFIGLDNWRTLVSDPLTITSLGVTFKFALVAIPFWLIVPILIASLLNSKSVKGKPLLRTLFYLPYIVPAVSAIFIWQSVLNTQAGWINRILRLLGVQDPPAWLQNESWILIAFMIIGLWGIGNAMLTTLATMQGVPTELYEAAEVDGAGPLTRWRKITLPMISPVIFYNLVLLSIGVMNYFVVPYIVSRGTGQPGQSAYFFNMHLYKTAFAYGNMGYGATLAWVIFGICLLITVVLFATSRRWVYYSSGD
ncbi:MAG: ABC transporter permease [Chloroflexi bacterium OLB15]|nr:MAG: ABC transporter permease [Chloroflexi bacterium OLB15]